MVYSTRFISQTIIHKQGGMLKSIQIMKLNHVHYNDIQQLLHGMHAIRLTQNHSLYVNNMYNIEKCLYMYNI